MSSSHKPVSTKQEGTEQNGVLAIQGKGETGNEGGGTGSGLSPSVALPEPVSVPHPDWPRQTQSGAGEEAVFGEQLNHHSLPASQKIVTARVKPGPVVSCCPLVYNLGLQ